MTEQKTWKVNDIIRHKQTGKPFLIIHIYTNVGTMVADLEEKHPVARMLFKRDYEDFARDCDMKAKETTDDTDMPVLSWEFDPIPASL